MCFCDRMSCKLHQHDMRSRHWFLFVLQPRTFWFRVFLTYVTFNLFTFIYLRAYIKHIYWIYRFFWHKVKNEAILHTLLDISSRLLCFMCCVHLLQAVHLTVWMSFVSKKLVTVMVVYQGLGARIAGKVCQFFLLLILKRLVFFVISNIYVFYLKKPV